jgi:hypothetical protein
MTTPQTKDQAELREKLRKVVTRNGKSGRIPELLEVELDDLEALFDQELVKREREAWGRGYTAGTLVLAASVASEMEKVRAQLSKENTREEK